MRNRLFFVILLLISSICTVKGEYTYQKDIQIPTAQGNIHAILQEPQLKEGEKCPIVILMHGITANCNDPLFQQIAEELYNAGIASIRFDFDGHGSSYGKFIDMTVPKEIEDAHAVYDYIDKIGHFSSISCLGHSQGGVVASMFAGEMKEKVHSLVLMAPAAVLEDDAKNGCTLGLSFDPNNIPEYLEAFGYKIGREFLQIAQHLNIYEHAAEYKGPACIIHGAADNVVPASYGEKYHEIYTGSDLFILENENHGFSRNRNAATNIAVNYLIRQLR